MRLEEIAFDDQDKNLFQVADARLRADALRHSLLPRMHVVLKEACARIGQVYGVDVFEDSIVSSYPHFRKKRDRELELLYEQAFVGLGGRRAKEKWHGFTRKDGKLVQVVPFRFAFLLSEEGMGLVLENNWAKGLADESYHKLLAFVDERAELVSRLCFETGMVPLLACGGGVRPISPLRGHYRFMMDIKFYDNHFLSRETPYPVQAQGLDSLIFNYVLFFPLYDSYIKIAKGEPVRFDQLIEKANDWLEAAEDEEALEQEEPGSTEPGRTEHLRLAASEAAEQRIPVMPALRWQVFQRDKWKCVACGRTSHDGIILHVDHILPRSRGGRDTLENFQTLCNLCNLGKSNRDATDLRRTVT